MDFFDLRTAYLIMGVHYFTMPTAIWLALRQKRSPAVSAWCSAGILFGLGLVLLSRRTHWPDWATYDLPNLVVCMGQLAGVQALRLELGRPLMRRTVLAMTVVFFLLYELSVMLDPTHKLQYLLSLSCLTVYFGWFGQLGWRLGHEQKLKSAYWLCGVCVPAVVLSATHALMVLHDLVPPGSLHTNAGTVGIALMGNMVAMVGSTCFLGMYLERAQRALTPPCDPTGPTRPDGQRACQIAQLERERSMGLVASSVVHELSQPLTSIALIAEHAELDGRQRPQDSAAVREHVAQILQQSKLAAQVLQRIRHYIAPRQVLQERLDLQTLNTQALNLLQDRLRREHVALEISGVTAPVHVLGDPSQLSLLLLSLYRHAIDASAGQLQRQVQVRIALRADRVHVDVQNNGRGLSPQALEDAAKGWSLFNPQSTDELGVGLRVGRKIAMEHQGHLRLSSLPGVGGLAQLDLPCV